MSKFTNPRFKLRTNIKERPLYMTQSQIHDILAAIEKRSMDFRPDPVATRESFAHGPVDGDNGYTWGTPAPIGATRSGSVSPRKR